MFMQFELYNQIIDFTSELEHTGLNKFKGPFSVLWVSWHFASTAAAYIIIYWRWAANTDNIHEIIQSWSFPFTRIPRNRTDYLSILFCAEIHIREDGSLTYLPCAKPLYHYSCWFTDPCSGNRGLYNMCSLVIDWQLANCIADSFFDRAGIKKIFSGIWGARLMREMWNVVKEKSMDAVWLLALWRCRVMILDWRNTFC